MPSQIKEVILDSNAFNLLATPPRAWLTPSQFHLVAQRKLPLDPISIPETARQGSVSIFPLLVNGSVSSGTTIVGTIYSGSLPLRNLSNLASGHS